MSGAIVTDDIPGDWSQDDTEVMCRDECDGWTCTARIHHTGPHAAYSLSTGGPFGRLRAVWTDED